MYIKKISIDGYKGIQGPFSIDFHEGLNILIGENSSGKTTIIDAIRLIMRENEFGYTPVISTDFHRPITSGSQSSPRISIKADLGSLSPQEQVIFLPWTDKSGDASLTLQVDNKERRGHYKRSIWAGSSKSSAFEWDLFDRFNCIYLPPLRDAESKLRPGKSSRLARLLKTLETKQLKSSKEKGDLHPLEKSFKEFNEKISKDNAGAISKANDLIRSKLKDSLGEVFAQDTAVQFSEVNFNRIVESLRLLYFPNITGAKEASDYRLLEENSLGYNNLLYLATVLAELIDDDDSQDSVKLLLIEEPEAHLHPQLQIRLLKYLESISHKNNLQIIVTSHSPVLASSAKLDSLIHLSYSGSETTSIPLRETGVKSASSSDFLNRWLDTTKSTLLFAKGIILVEGIAEAFLIPEMAKSVLKKHNAEGGVQLPVSLEDAGVSVINMNGIYFNHFMQMFCSVKDEYDSFRSIPIRCSGITDLDPPKNIEINGKKIEAIPSYENKIGGKNHALRLVDKINSSPNCRLYVSPLKTLEYDLAFEGENMSIMAAILEKNWPKDGSVKTEIAVIKNKDWKSITDQKVISKDANTLLNRIDDTNMGKGFFAQLLAESISSGGNLLVPKYISEAIIWSCGEV